MRQWWRIGKKLSGKRLYTIVQLILGFYLSRWLKRPVWVTRPMAVSVEPTTSCNLRCPECPSGLRSFTRPTGMLNPEIFDRMLDQISGHTLFLTFYFQGEPFLNPGFLDMVKRASDRKLYTITSTNAHYLTAENARKTVQSGLDELIISLDGTTQDVYQQYRVGGQLQKVLEGARNILEARSKANASSPKVIFQFLVVKPNEHQIDDALSVAKSIGVDEIRFKTAQIYDFEQGNPLIPENTNYSRYEKLSNGRYRIKNTLENHCWKMWSSCVFTWDGKVVPCCFDKDARFPMGVFPELDFDQIWFGQKYVDFRWALMSGRSKIDICRNCSEGTKVFS